MEVVKNKEKEMKEEKEADRQVSDYPLPTIEVFALQIYSMQREWR